MIAYHYAEPIECALVGDAALRPSPNEDAVAISLLNAGEQFILLDNSLGWAWGYGGPDRRVGYIRSEALGAD